tara:strand:+ start:2429 stop:2917 length:489 start_codon:yes stop_codon:yes gene_type:complete
MRDIKDIQEDMSAYTGKKSSKGYRTLKKELSAAEELKTSLGLGDVVEAITTVTGIKSVVKAVLGEDCGCEERKKAWNDITVESIKSLFRSKNVVNEISVEDYEYLCDLFNNGMPLEIKAQQQRDIHQVYKNVFNIIKPPTSCSPCIKSTVEELYKVYQMNTK